ncbi:hypothetical protein ACFQ3Z_01715 [Streptomyces nogalater]
MLILHGRTIHPQDIEAELRAQHGELGSLHGAVFTVGWDDGTGSRESVVVLHEIRGHWGTERMTELAAAMKLTVAREFGVPVAAVLLLRPAASAARPAARWSGPRCAHAIWSGPWNPCSPARTPT